MRERRSPGHRRLSFLEAALSRGKEIQSHMNKTVHINLLFLTLFIIFLFLSFHSFLLEQINRIRFQSQINEIEKHQGEAEHVSNLSSDQLRHKATGKQRQG